jgi:hypothetical protein
MKWRKNVVELFTVVNTRSPLASVGLPRGSPSPSHSSASPESAHLSRQSQKPPPPHQPAATGPTHVRPPAAGACFFFFASLEEAAVAVLCAASPSSSSCAASLHWPRSSPHRSHARRSSTREARVPAILCAAAPFPRPGMSNPATLDAGGASRALAKGAGSTRGSLRPSLPR